MQPLNATLDSRPYTKNKEKNPTIERQQILEDENYI